MSTHLKYSVHMCRFMWNDTNETTSVLLTLFVIYSYDLTVRDHGAGLSILNHWTARKNRIDFVFIGEPSEYRPIVPHCILLFYMVLHEWFFFFFFLLNRALLLWCRVNPQMYLTPRFLELASCPAH